MEHERLLTPDDLTEGGRAWCEEHEAVDVTANVALYGPEMSWPPAFVSAAVKVANEYGGEAQRKEVNDDQGVQQGRA